MGDPQSSSTRLWCRKQSCSPCSPVSLLLLINCRHFTEDRLTRDWWGWWAWSALHFVSTTEVNPPYACQSLTLWGADVTNCPWPTHHQCGGWRYCVFGYGRVSLLFFAFSGLVLVRSPPSTYCSWLALSVLACSCRAPSTSLSHYLALFSVEAEKNVWLLQCGSKRHAKTTVFESSSLANHLIWLSLITSLSVLMCWWPFIFK